jgi:hypothetical protein
VCFNIERRILGWLLVTALPKRLLLDDR